MAIILTYVLRFFGDLVSVIVGGLSAVPFAYSLFKQAPQWLTSDYVKWGVLALGFVVVSYRMWLRAEHSRTSDCVGVLVNEIRAIREQVLWIIESYRWPQYEDGQNMPNPFSDWNPDQFHKNTKALALPQLAKIRARMVAHKNLLLQTAEEHNIDLREFLTLEPDALRPETAVIRIDEYIERLRGLAMPPRTLIQRTSTQRVRRLTTHEN